MGNIDYSAYIFASYAIALVSMFAMLISGFRRHKALKRELAKARPKKRS